MTETRTLTGTAPGGGTADLGVTATATDAEIERMVQTSARFLTESWRRQLYAMRAELGGEPAPAPHASSLPPCPMPGRMRAWETADALWLQWIPGGDPLDLDHAVAQRIPVSATDSDEQLAAAAERWLTGDGAPPEGTIEWVLPQLIAHRNRLADALG